MIFKKEEIGFFVVPFSCFGYVYFLGWPITFGYVHLPLVMVLLKYSFVLGGFKDAQDGKLSSLVFVVGFVAEKKRCFFVEW